MEPLNYSLNYFIKNVDIKVEKTEKSTFPSTYFLEKLTKKLNAHFAFLLSREVFVEEAVLIAFCEELLLNDFGIFSLIDVSE